MREVLKSRVVGGGHLSETLPFQYYTLHPIMFHSVTLSSSVVYQYFIDTNPAKTEHLYNMYTMLDQRRRRWTNVV